MVYSREFRENALKVIEEIGVKKAVKELNVSEATLYAWRKQAREAALSGAELNCADHAEERDEENMPGSSNPDLKREVEDLRKLNQSCRNTIAMMAEETAALRRQCEDYLRAIVLIAGER